MTTNQDLRPGDLSWTALLGQWVDFARASLALPDNAEGRRWQDSVTPIITLQAVTFALGELDTLAVTDRAHAADRASVLIKQQAEAIEHVWGDAEALPPMIDDVLDAALSTLQRQTAVTELIWPGPGMLEVPEVSIEHCAGTLLLMQPGTLALPGEPVASWQGDAAIHIDIAGAIHAPGPVARQVYRVFDDHRIVRDVIVAADADNPPVDSGSHSQHLVLPLLVPLFVNGERVGHFTLDRESWVRTQRDALDTGAIPVEHVTT